MKIARRAGHPAWLGALMSVPLLNVVVIWVFAVSSWPALERPGAGDYGGPT